MSMKLKKITAARFVACRDPRRSVTHASHLDIIDWPVCVQGERHIKRVVMHPPYDDAE